MTGSDKVLPGGCERSGQGKDSRGVVVMEKQILVVDDTNVLASWMTSVLARPTPGPMTVDLARSSTAAEKLLENHAYDLLLVNSQTESLDSMDVLRQLRDGDCDTEAVVVAGWLTPQLLQVGQRLGVKRYFRLPAELVDLTQHLRFA
jgi:DNA-binding NarL/FixJ family response regulator